jgi:hypothetical protein
VGAHCGRSDPGRCDPGNAAQTSLAETLRRRRHPLLRSCRAHLFRSIIR